jgi:hypothetical protein
MHNRCVAAKGVKCFILVESVLMNIPVDIVLVVSLPPTHHHRACELFAHRHHHLILVVLTNLIHGPYALHGPDKQDTVSILDRRVQPVGEEKHFVTHVQKILALR